MTLLGGNEKLLASIATPLETGHRMEKLPEVAAHAMAGHDGRPLPAPGTPDAFDHAEIPGDATILIVDNEARNRRLLAAMLKRRGYCALCAGSGEEALTMIAQRAPDLILLDIVMPDMDGYQVARSLKANPATSNIPIIMVTAHTERSTRLKGLNAGAEEFLTTPVDQTELWLRVRNLLRMKAYGDFLRDHNRILEEKVEARATALQRFRAAMDATADGIFLVNRATMRFVEVNATACTMLGYTREELLDMGPAQVAATTVEELAAVYDAIIAGDGTHKFGEILLRRKDGSQLRVEAHRQPHRAGEEWIIVGVMRDITERRKTQRRIEYLNRVYAMLSGINTLIVRVRDRGDLFTEACCIAVEHGRFDMAWIGMLERGSMKLVPVASAGVDADALTAIKERFALSLTASPALKISMAAQALRERQVVVSNDTQSDPQVVFSKRFTGPGIRSMAMLPLIVAGEAVGVLALYASELEFFHADELTLLTELAGDIAFAIENIGKEEKLARLSRIQAVTSGINAAIVHVQTRQQLFNEACRIGVEHGQFGLAWIGELDPVTQDVTPVAWAGEGGQALAGILSSARDDVPQGMGAVGRAIRERRAVFNNDIAAAALGGPRAKEIVKLGFRSQITLPLYEGKGIAGTLTMYAREPDFFVGEEVTLLTGLAGNISFALDHIGKEEKIARLSRIQAVMSGINSAIVHIGDRQALFNEACRIAVEYGGFGIAWIGMFDRVAQEITPMAWGGIDANVNSEPRSSRADTPEGQGLAARAVREKTAVFDNDIAKRAEVGGGRRKEAIRRGYGSLIALPLLAQGVVLGTLSLFAKEAGFFDAEELTLLTELAGNIAFAIENIGRQEKLEKLSRIRAVSAEINVAIVHIFEPDALLREVYRIVVEHGKFSMVWVAALDEAGQEVRPVAWRGFSREVASAVNWSRIIAAEGTLSEAILTRKPAMRDDIQSDALSSGLRHEALQNGCRSIVCVPLVVDGKVAALIVLFAPGVGFFVSEEVALLSEVAANVSFALENIEKETRIARLNRIQTVTGNINALIVRVRERQELFSEACRIAVEHGRFKMAWIGVVDRDAMKIVPAASAGAEAAEFLTLIKDEFSLREDAPPGNTMSARAVREKKAVVSNDIREHPRVLFAKERADRGLVSMAILPLLVAGDAVGVLALYAGEPGFFDEAEVKLLTALAGDIAFALEHIGNEEKIARLSRIQAFTSEINSVIVRVRDRQALFDEICRAAVEQGKFGIAWTGTYDAAARALTPVAWAGPASESLARASEASPNDFVNGTGVVSRAIREKRAVFDNDIAGGVVVRSSRRAAAIRAGFHSLIAVPFVIADAVVGHLSLYAKEVGFFNDDELRLLNELAGNISFALEHMDRQDKLEKLSRIRAVSGEINAAIVRIREREALLQEVCRIAVAAGKFDLVWVGALDQKTEKARSIAWAGFPSAMAHPIDWKALTGPETALAESMRTGKIAVRNDFAVQMAAGVLRDEAVRRGCRSAVCLPLLMNDNVEAAILLYAPGVNFFDHDELALLNEVAADISLALQSIARREQLDYLAYYDVLTGLANRALFHERLEQSVTNAKEQGRKVALLLLDIERFKTINDTLGRRAGDALLKEVAARASAFVTDPGRLARIDADHFAVMVTDLQTEEELARLLEQRIGEIFVPPFRIGDSELRVSAKFGIAMYPADGADADTLFRNAETALEKAKARGERYLFYTQNMNARVAQNLSLENRLRQAIEKEEFVLHYQPKVNLANGKLTSAEALIRWNDPQTGLVPPGHFIPILEETGMIYEVGRWALRQAIADYLRWRAAGLPAVRIAVNVSPLQLRNRGFVAEIGQVIGIDPHAAAGLELEITEGVIMDDVKKNIGSLEAIRAMGVTIAIDDFGTGFSSLSYLARLPVDTLKIDRAFVVDMTCSPEGLALVSTIINLAHALKHKVVAEGVETEEQAGLLRLLNCDEMQGYLFSKPVPAEMFESSFLALPAAA